MRDAIGPPERVVMSLTFEQIFPFFNGVNWPSKREQIHGKASRVQKSLSPTDPYMPMGVLCRKEIAGSVTSLMQEGREEEQQPQSTSVYG